MPQPHSHVVYGQDGCVNHTAEIRRLRFLTAGDVPPQFGDFAFELGASYPAARFWGGAVLVRRDLSEHMSMELARDFSEH